MCVCARVSGSFAHKTSSSNDVYSTLQNNTRLVFVTSHIRSFVYCKQYVVVYCASDARVAHTTFTLHALIQAIQTSCLLVRDIGLYIYIHTHVTSHTSTSHVTCAFYEFLYTARVTCSPLQSVSQVTCIRCSVAFLMLKSKAS